MKAGGEGVDNKEMDCQKTDKGGWQTQANQPPKHVCLQECNATWSQMKYKIF